MKNIVIKIGSNTLTLKNGRLNEAAISALAEDIIAVQKKNKYQIVIVSSGAVSAGRSIVNLSDFKIESEAVDYDKEVLREQILASIGQPEVMATWKKSFKKHKVNCAQLLTTRSVFANRKDYLSIRSVTINLLRLGITPIFNENDVRSPEKLDFTDNDQQACMVAAMLLSEKLIILSDVDGVYTGSPKNPSSKLIPKIEKPSDFLDSVDAKSGSGKGGMKSKLLTADLATSLGIDMYIANGLEPRVISRIMEGEMLGTFFPAKTKEKMKPVKTWLASAAAGEGKITVSTYLAEILKTGQKTASILFSGIEEVTGQFSEKDVVEICDEKGLFLGRGLVRFNSSLLKEKLDCYKKMTNKEKASLKTSEIIAIHYDQLVYR